MSKYYVGTLILWDVQRTITNSKSNEQCEFSFRRNRDSEKMEFKVKRGAKETKNSCEFQPSNCDDSRFFRLLFGEAVHFY